MVFRSTALGTTYGKVALAPLDNLDGPRYTTPLECDRVHFAAGHGLCLVADRGVFTTYRAYTFSADFAPRYTFPLGGIPCRARLSLDGRHGAMTVFVSGHSYAQGGFSTQTTLIDVVSGTVLGDLEQFAIWREGARFQAPDFNFWGVSFARDGNRFYATLASGGKFYLIEGDVAAKEARVLRENVECPSLSPDETRLVFKKRLPTEGRVGWQLYVLDLATLSERPLAETRNVDDQVEWLDNDHVVYALPEDGPTSSATTNTWVLPVDGTQPPRVLLSYSFSPAVVR
jgi:hypothetical protein